MGLVGDDGDLDSWLCVSVCSVCSVWLYIFMLFEDDIICLFVEIGRF